jgi:hypothetical protein
MCLDPTMPESGRYNRERRGRLSLNGLSLARRSEKNSPQKVIALSRPFTQNIFTHRQCNHDKETMMALTKEQEDLYRKTMEEAKAQLETIDEEMEKEIQKARERLARLQESKRSFRQLYEGAARLLGVKIEEEEDESSDQAELKQGLGAGQGGNADPKDQGEEAAAQG